jgi:hypothetical protein
MEQNLEPFRTMRGARFGRAWTKSIPYTTAEVLTKLTNIMAEGWKECYPRDYYEHVHGFVKGVLSDAGSCNLSREECQQLEHYETVFKKMKPPPRPGRKEYCRKLRSRAASTKEMQPPPRFDHADHRRKLRRQPAPKKY